MSALYKTLQSELNKASAEQVKLGVERAKYEMLERFAAQERAEGLSFEEEAL